jgi:hypothetical protein
VSERDAGLWRGRARQVLGGQPADEARRAKEDDVELAICAHARILRAATCGLCLMRTDHRSTAEAIRWGCVGDKVVKIASVIERRQPG